MEVFTCVLIYDAMSAQDKASISLETAMDTITWYDLLFIYYVIIKPTNDNCIKFENFLGKIEINQIWGKF